MVRFREAVKEELDVLAPMWLLVIVAMLACATIVLIPFVIQRWKLIRQMKPVADAAREMVIPWLDRAELRMAAPVMVTSHIRRPGKEPANGLFLISESTSDSMRATAEIMGNLESPSADAAAIDSLVNDEKFTFRRWRQVPLAVTAGETVYAIDLTVMPQFLAGSHLSDDCPFVPVAVDLQPGGLAMVVPYWCFGGQQPTEEEKETLLLLLLSLPEQEQQRKAAT